MDCGVRRRAKQCERGGRDRGAPRRGRASIGPHPAAFFRGVRAIVSYAHPLCVFLWRSGAQYTQGERRGGNVSSAGTSVIRDIYLRCARAIICAPMNILAPCRLRHILPTLGLCARRACGGRAGSSATSGHAPGVAGGEDAGLPVLRTFPMAYVEAAGAGRGHRRARSDSPPPPAAICNVARPGKRRRGRDQRHEIDHKGMGDVEGSGRFHRTAPNLVFSLRLCRCCRT